MLGWVSDEKRRPGDPENETIIFEAGYPTNSYVCGWFCQVSKNGVCVEAFAETKRVALRRARRAWRKTNERGYNDLHGYPRVISCE